MPTLQANGVDLYYELHGPEGAPLLVLNNGIIMNASTSWVFQTKTLAQRYRVLQYDCRGQGKSEHPAGPYSMALHAADLAALLDGLGVPQAHIAGISYGGEVAQAFAMDYPGRTRSLFLADTVSEVGPELRIIVGCWINALRTGSPDAFFNATVPWNFSPAFIAANPALLEDARRRYAMLDFSAVLRLCECFLEVNFTPRLGEIQAPACIVAGAEDILKGPRYAAILQRGLPHAEQHILEGAGHAACWERPAAFNSILLGFLQKVDGTG